MASAQSLATFRAITYRISSTPTKQLPHIAPQAAASLWSCKDVLSASRDSPKTASELSSLAHRFKTTLSSLLQDRTVEGRWAAVVLTKAAIEAGGVDLLSKSNNWVRSLLAILKKPDPPTTRALTVITLARIFILTWEYPNLVREITTPALPAFISTCLSNAENKRCSAAELQTVLEAFASLIARHPTMFRTHEAQIRSLLVRILSSASSNSDGSKHYTQSHRDVAQRLLVLLHHCAPKQGAGDKWDETFKSIIAAAHSTCDRLFRSIIENWTSAAGYHATVTPSTLLAGELAMEGEDAAGLTSWTGVFAGSRRLTELLGSLRAHVQTASAGAVNVRIGLLVDLIARVFALTVPGPVDSLQANNEVSKDEREALFSVLPLIHIATFELVDTMLHRFSDSAFAFVQGLLDSITNIYLLEGSNTDVRTAVYKTTTAVLNLIGPSLSKRAVADLGPILRRCCTDLLPSDRTDADVEVNGVSQMPQLSNGDLALHIAKTKQSHPTVLSEIQDAAEVLLPTILNRLNSVNVPKGLRTQLERTAILTRNKDALVACVMNPSKKDPNSGPQISLMPVLAREYPDSAELESLLRPRMPVGTTKPAQAAETNIDKYWDDEGPSEICVADFLCDLPEEDATVTEAIRHHAALQRERHQKEEPTNGLIGALNQDSDHGFAREQSEDLYSATPPRKEASIIDDSATSTAQKQQVHDGSSTKRVAAEPVDFDIAAKRLRASPIANIILSDTSAALSGPGAVSANSSLPATVVFEPLQGGSVQTATIPSQRLDSTVAERPAVEEADDDSDFEMPPLTLEQDTDSDSEDQVAAKEGAEGGTDEYLKHDT